MRWPFARRNRRVALPRLDQLGERVVEAKPRRRIGGWVVLALSLVALMGGLSQSPRLLRRMDTFRVRKVEVRGTRWLAPDEVLAVSGVDERSSVFDSPDPWIAALERHPMIQSVKVVRRLPQKAGDRAVLVDRPVKTRVRSPRICADIYQVFVLPV